MKGLDDGVGAASSASGHADVGPPARLNGASQTDSLSLMAGGIAHEFNNLLMGVLGNVDLLLGGGDLTPELRRRLRGVEEGAVKAAALAEQMLTYSGRVALEREDLDLRDLVETLRPSLIRATPEGARLLLELEPASPVRVDRERTRRALRQVLRNAAEAVEPTGGLIRVRTGVASLDELRLPHTAYESGSRREFFAFVEVQDEGVGMDEETLSRAFDPFFTTKFPGRGLGLAEVLGVVRAQLGRIEIRSETGAGTTLRLLFPLSESNLGPARRKPVVAPIAAADPGGLDGRRVLFVDDDPAVCAVSVALLERHGPLVEAVQSGEEALERFRAAEQPYDAVMLDLTMPGMNGETCFHELRRLDPGLRVVITSGLAQDVVEQRFAGQQRVRFVQKPYRSEELQACLRQLFDGEGGSARIAP